MLILEFRGRVFITILLQSVINNSSNICLAWLSITSTSSVNLPITFSTVYGAVASNRFTRTVNNDYACILDLTKSAIQVSYTSSGSTRVYAFVIGKV